MTRPVRAMGGGSTLAPELILRQLLLEGLYELAGDAPRLDELFGRVDTLRSADADAWLVELRQEVERMLPGRQSSGLTVRVGYPGQDARWPYVSIVMERDDEDASGATVGDTLSERTEVIGTFDANDASSVRLYTHTVLGCDEKLTLQVGIWTRAPERAAALTAVIQHLLFRHKGDLAKAGARDLSMATSGFAPDPDAYATVGFVPLIRVTMTWTRRQTRTSGPHPSSWTYATTFGN